MHLEVRRDEIVALVGQSGSGKTTLARTLLGLQKPDSGTVRYAGKPVPSGGAGLRAYRREVQLVLQDPTSALNPAHTVYEAVAEGPRIHGLPNERDIVLSALESAELRPPEKYLGLPRTSCPAASASASSSPGPSRSNPRCCSPTSRWPRWTRPCAAKSSRCCSGCAGQTGLSALVITHDLGLAWNIADRVAVMFRGELVETGTVEQVLLDPRHEYTKSLLAALPGGTAQRTAADR